MKQFSAVVFRHGCRRAGCPESSKQKPPRAAAPAAACVAGRSRGQHMLPQQPSKQTAIAPPTKPKKQKAHNTRRVAPEHVKESPKPKTPRAVSPEAACVSDHSRGQDLPPATALRTNDNNTPTIVIPDIISRKRKENIRNLRRQAGMTPHWRECEAPLRRTRRHGAATEKGGLSGRPLFSRAVEVIGILRESLPAGAMLIGSWGGGAAADAHAHFRAGADLVQVYTGLIYRGPELVDKILRDFSANGI